MIERDKSLFKLTVILCVYNEGISIITAIRSLYKNEIFIHTELIIIDDCSQSEFTKALLARLIKFTRIKVIRSNENMGLSNSRNLGFENASTNYVFPLDADDILPPNSLDFVYKEFSSNPTIDFVVGNYEVVDVDKAEKVQIGCSSISISGLIDAKKLSRHWELLGTSPCKKSAWAKIGGYNLKYSYTVQDVDFWIRILEHNCIGKYVNETIYTWNKSSKGMSAQFDRFDMVRLLEDHPKFYLLGQSKKQLYNRIFEGHYPYKQTEYLISLGKKYFLWLTPINMLRLAYIAGNSFFSPKQK